MLKWLTKTRAAFPALLRGTALGMAVWVLGSLASAAMPPPTVPKHAPPAPPAPPARPSGSVFTDLKQTMKVRQLLLGDRDLAPLNLGIQVKDGVATVWGPVHSETQAQRALQLVRGMDGVDTVKNQLYVRRPVWTLEILPPGSERGPTQTSSAVPDRSSGSLRVLDGMALELPPFERTATARVPVSPLPPVPLPPAPQPPPLITPRDPPPGAAALAFATAPRSTATAKQPSPAVRTPTVVKQPSPAAREPAAAKPSLPPTRAPGAVVKDSLPRVPGSVVKTVPRKDEPAGGLAKASLTREVERLRKERSVYQAVYVEVRGTTVVVRSGDGPGEYATAFAEEVRKIRGVGRVLLEE